MDKFLCSFSLFSSVVNILFLALYLPVVSRAEYSFSNPVLNPQEFYRRILLQDGIHQIDLSLAGIRATETAVGPREGSSSGIVLRQITNGKQVISLIYVGIPSYMSENDQRGENFDLPSSADDSVLSLSECKVEKHIEKVHQFIVDFDKTSLNNTIASIDGSTIPSELSSSTYKNLKGKSDDEIPRYLRHLLQFRKLKHKCFKLHREWRVLAKKEKNKNSKNEEERKENSTSIKRPRRAVADILSIPNTKWCGRGNSANVYGELGASNGADNCCRQHDSHCPFFIRSFERKYGYFNFGLGTLSHCACDLRFRTCLKQSGTGASEVVGNVFFNIVQSKCFDFRRKKVCLKRGIWSCHKWGYENQAYIKEPLPWNKDKQ